MWRLAELTMGRSVALVGNAKSLITGPGAAKEIDSHDVVIRMNAGLPGVLPHGKVGRKTDVWATAKHFPGLSPDVKLMIFMKLTKLGDAHWKHFQEDSGFTSPMTRWPADYEAEVRGFVGADPGTGIRILYYLKRFCCPTSLGIYGMDCWDTLSSWSNKPNTPNHVPLLEKDAMQRLLSE